MARLFTDMFSCGLPGGVNLNDQQLNPYDREQKKETRKGGVAL
jgi:hypothetical protein